MPEFNLLFDQSKLNNNSVCIDIKESPQLISYVDQFAIPSQIHRISLSLTLEQHPYHVLGSISNSL